MNDANQHLLTLFTAALEHAAGADRDAFLNEACAGDAALRARVEALLRAHEPKGRFLEPDADSTSDGPSAAPMAETAHLSTTTGSVIAGRYKLLEEIGEGGMGAVWMAEQSQPLQRKVAVKITEPIEQEEPEKPSSRLSDSGEAP